MKIFHYSPETGELIAADAAREDPLMQGEFRPPAFATPDTPPAFVSQGAALAYLNDQGQAPADFRDGAWRELEDYRGTYWRIDNGQLEYLGKLGVTPAAAGLTAKAPPQFGKWTGKAWKVDQKAAVAAANAAIEEKIAEIERTEQPAAQRAFALEGDASGLRAIQEKINALKAQIQE
ncbi:phage tail protein [Herbaspirillum chlorophenolicum]|uniref:Phage tail protein n=1 Tax=Herbaspirillum chlorophenolicum TaxID=211589 RepID=A0ABW8F121_9BURK